MEEILPHNILIISNKPPYPSIDGGCFAMAKFEQLIRGCFKEVHYFTISTHKHPFVEKDLPKQWRLNDNFFTEFIDTKIQNKHVIKFFLGSSIRASRFYSSAIEKKILSIITEKKIEIVFFESIYAAVYLNAIKKLQDVKIFIRSHNIEHQLWEKYFYSMKRGFKRLVFRSETTRLKAFENKCLQESDGNIFISMRDFSYCEKKLSLDNGICIPTQIQTKNGTHEIGKGPLKLFHIGAMDWLPNIVGVEKFISKIFPEILKTFPSIELHLAGKAMPDFFNKYKSKNIFIHGQVEDSNVFIANFDILIVPIESGSGIRIKILEAMAAGKTVISTRAGIEGIEVENRKEFIMANNTKEWLQAINFLHNEEKYLIMSKAGILFIRKNYSEEVLLHQLLAFFKNKI